MRQVRIVFSEQQLGRAELQRMFHNVIRSNTAEVGKSIYIVRVVQIEIDEICMAMINKIMHTVFRAL